MNQTPFYRALTLHGSRVHGAAELTDERTLCGRLIAHGPFDIPFPREIDKELPIDWCQRCQKARERIIVNQRLRQLAQERGSK